MSPTGRLRLSQGGAKRPLMSMQYFSNPTRFTRLAGRIQPWAAGLAAGLLIAGLYLALVVAPADYQQGDTVRIMFVHVPSAWMALFCYSFLAVASAVALIWKHPLADMAAKASAPIGAGFTFLALVTGSLWGKPMWGTWWVWDARLTSMLVLWLMYAGYLLFRSTTKGDVRRTYSSVFGILAFVMVPIVYFSIRIWGSVLHPNEKTKFNLDNRMYHGMALGTLAMLAAYVLLTRLRADADIAEQEVAALRQKIDDLESEQLVPPVIDAAKGAGVDKVGIVTEGMRRAAGAAPVGE